MHPLDTESRIPEIKDDFGIGYCNITRCCTEVCPAGIQITDNAIIPLKERVVTDYYDPLVDPIKAAFNISSGVLAGVLSPFTDEFSSSRSDPGNLEKAKGALEKERVRAEEARLADITRTERARKRHR